MTAVLPAPRAALEPRTAGGPVPSTPLDVQDVTEGMAITHHVPIDSAGTDAGATR